MPDIELRFNKDMLVLSAPVETSLRRQGVDVERDREFLGLIEPEAVRDAYRLEMIAGVQCLTTNTAGITRARLAHINLEDRAAELATASLTIANALKPQHVLAEIGPTLLPLDATSASLLKQNSNQYAQAARDFGERGFDAFFLNGFSKPLDMQGALMGIRKVSDKPIFASFEIDRFMEEGKPSQEILDAFAMMREYGADVVGFASARPLPEVVALAHAIRQCASGPLLAQLTVRENKPEQQKATMENPYYCPDTMVSAATYLRGEGVQFLRACGAATPAYTGALVAASAGFDVIDLER